MSDPQQERIPVIIDSDGCEVSCDALWYALTSDAYEVVAVTGELGVTNPEQAARNFCKVLHAAGRSDVPVGVGTADRLGPAPDIPSPASVHGDDGLAGLHPDDAPFGPVASPLRSSSPGSVPSDRVSSQSPRSGRSGTWPARCVDPTWRRTRANS